MCAWDNTIEEAKRPQKKEVMIIYRKSQDLLTLVEIGGSVLGMLKTYIRSMLSVHCKCSDLKQHSSSPLGKLNIA